jgi:hypothetical protein
VVASAAIAPESSVTVTAAPRSARRRTISRCGCPNRLPRPAEMSAIRGASAATKSAALEPRDPG